LQTLRHLIQRHGRIACPKDFQRLQGFGDRAREILILTATFRGRRDRLGRRAARIFDRLPTFYGTFHNIEIGYDNSIK
jgi:hypothetical protein